MGLLLEFFQDENRFPVGRFENETNLFIFFNSIPFIKRESTKLYNHFFMEYNDVPEYYEAKYKNNIYIISKFSFANKDKRIECCWNYLTNFEDYKNSDTIIQGTTLIDGFSIANNEVKKYVYDREELFSESKKYFKLKGISVERGGYGSQDGEYVSVGNLGDFKGMFFILDPFAVDVWCRDRNFEQFMVNYPNALDNLLSAGDL